jgi:hypothetical protein
MGGRDGESRKQKFGKLVSVSAFDLELSAFQFSAF